jgi:AP-1 complex subunit beta-1
MAGQQAENLLDFDDEPSTSTPVSGGMGETSRPGNDRGLISTQQISSAAKSTNPLDELMDLFSTASMAAPSQPVGAPAGGGGMGGMELDLMSPPAVSSPVAGQPAKAQTKGDDDLLGLF